MDAVAGETLSIPILCYRIVNDVEELYDPTVVSGSIVLSDGTEEMLTYGGTDPGDNHISRESVGKYWLSYVLPEDGTRKARIRIKTIDVVGTESWPSKSEEILVRIKQDNRNYADTP